ncbi:RluA family pseudouridine synthase [Adlercreutzia murintestinalis]|uniref:RluA family pseudouridine synthase n=1 Tax=Adlercreutzia murintestinalis TaxID=2941325 RepID=UPI00203AB20D|nr:RluA family pseudouridine synthase [Adlercreutzia murintestinalis]
MARSVCHVVAAAEDGERLDALLAACGLYASRSAAAKAASANRVLVAGETAQKSRIVRAGEAIVCELDDAPSEFVVEGEDIPLDIRFEDESLIVLSKQAGLLTHPSADHPSGTLANALVHHCGADHLCNVQGDCDRPGIVHRLDGDTSGLMLAAKTDQSGEHLMEAIRAREVDRRYVALVHGIIRHDTAMIDAPIARHPRERNRMAVLDAPHARDALTTLRVLERFAGGESDNGYTLVECKLFTGRTHQIRVHMQYVGHPVVGDQTYTAGAPRSAASSLGLDRQFLHSCALAFDHPISGAALSFRDALPADLRSALSIIRNRSEGLTDAGHEMADLIGGEQDEKRGS